MFQSIQNIQHIHHHLIENKKNKKETANNNLQSITQETKDRATRTLINPVFDIIAWSKMYLLLQMQMVSFHTLWDYVALSFFLETHDFTPCF